MKHISSLKLVPKWTASLLGLSNSQLDGLATPSPVLANERGG
jgi:hypothetical protein